MPAEASEAGDLAVEIEWQLPLESLTLLREAVDAEVDLGVHEGHGVTVVIRAHPADGDPFVSASGLIVRVASSTSVAALGTPRGDRAPTQEEDEEARRIRVDAYPALRTAVTDLLAWLGVSYGWSDARVSAWPLVGAGVVVVNGVETRSGGPPAEVTVTLRDRGVSSGELGAIGTWLTHGRRLGTGWKLYLDARRRWQHEEDARGTIVEAAAAVQVGSSEALRFVARDEELLDVALKGARLEDLLVGLPKIVLGVSLSEAHPAEYASLRAMQDDRNRLVHRGVDPSAERMTEYLEAVRATLYFFDTEADRRAGEMGYYDDILFDRWRGK